MALAVKKLPANAGDRRETGSIPGPERSPGGGHGHPLQYSCLETPTDRAGDPSLKWNKGALFAEMHVYIVSYKAALGSKKIEQKQSQANNNF